RARLREPPLVGESAVGVVARVGVVLRDGDRQPLLARRRGGGRSRVGGAPRRLRTPPPPGGSGRLATEGDRLSMSTHDPGEQGGSVPRVNRAARIKHGYTTGARNLASQTMTGLSLTRVTPNSLTTSGVTLCALASVLVYFEYRSELLFFWLGAFVFVVGSVLDILDGALARAGGKTTPFGSFLDSTTDRVGEGAMLGAIALIFARHGNQVALGATVAAVAGSFLVSYTRAKAEALGLRGDVGLGSRAERVVVITAGLVLAPWGGLQWAIYLLTATAWLTVLQRILFVRKQLVERK